QADPGTGARGVPVRRRPRRAGRQPGAAHPAALRPGQIERRTHDYKRHGTASLYAAFDIASGKIMGRVTKRHRSREFLAFLRQIEGSVEADLDLHLIMDNSSTHKTKEVR